MHTAADKNLYVHLLGHLRKKALLPVVVFTFSKKRCEENAATLTNADLCTSIEKSEVHVAVEKALSRLKGTAFNACCLEAMVSWPLFEVPIRNCPKFPVLEIYCRVVSVFIMAVCSRLLKRFVYHRLGTYWHR